MAIYLRLAATMKDRGISGYALAKASGLTPSAIYKLRKQKRLVGLKVDTLNRLCGALDCQPGDLLEYRPR
jgi:putative transcriptional regulator